MGNSPFIVPVAVFVWLSILAVAKVVGQVHARRLAADQRIAMVQHGMTPEQIAVVLQRTKEDEVELGAKINDPLRSLGNARRTAVVLVSMGVGLVVFGLLLTEILQVREVLTVAAAGLIPAAIGIGFFVDYNLQKRELSRFGLEVGAESPANQRPR